MRGMKKAIIAAAVLACAALAAYLYLWGGEEGAGYRTEPVTRGSIEASVTATGTVNAVTTVLVGTQVSGTIKEIYADFNSPVRKGQVIAEIDPGIFQAQVDQARANLLAARANLEKSAVKLKDSERTLARTRELSRRDLIARSELDSAETAKDSAGAEVTAARAQVAQAEAALKHAETNIRYTRILSPVNGIVVSRNVDVGQTVAASFQTPTLFTIAEDLTKMQVNSSVVEADIGKLQKGLPARFIVDAYPEEEFEGTVSEIRIAPVVVQNVVTYDVVIKVANRELKLKPGMTANVSIVYASREGALKAPNAAFRFNPNGGRKGQRPKGGGVWVLENGRPKRVPAAVGISDGTHTEVVSGELAEGQEVIVESLSAKKAPSRPPRLF